MQAPFEQVIEERFGLGSVLRKLPNGLQALSFSINLEFELARGVRGSYRLSLADMGDHSVGIEEEKCTLGELWFDLHSGVLKQNTSAPPVLGFGRSVVALGGLPEFGPVFEFLSGMAFYSPHAESMRVPTKKGSGKLLASNGANAADVLMRIERVAPALLPESGDTCTRSILSLTMS